MIEQVNDSMAKLLDNLEAKVNQRDAALAFETSLPLTVATVLKVDYNDLGQWAGKQLGVGNIEITEANNDTDHDFHVDGSDPLDFEEVVQKAVDQGSIAIWEARSLLNYFCSKGLVPAGNYLVSVCW